MRGNSAIASIRGIGDGYFVTAGQQGFRILHACFPNPLIRHYEQPSQNCKNINRERGNERRSYFSENDNCSLDLSINHKKKYVYLE